MAKLHPKEFIFYCVKWYTLTKPDSYLDENILKKDRTSIIVESLASKHLQIESLILKPVGDSENPNELIYTLESENVRLKNLNLSFGAMGPINLSSFVNNLQIGNYTIKKLELIDPNITQGCIDVIIDVVILIGQSAGFRVCIRDV